MRLYKLTRTDNPGYDEYDMCVVCAHTHDDAIKIDPSTRGEFIEKVGPSYDCWAKKYSDIDCEYIGEAAKDIERGVILASYCAG